MIDATAYRISVQKRSTDDGEFFEGTVAEFPDVAVFCETQEEAFREVAEVIESLASQYSKLGRSMPPPIPRQDEYSGKFLVRGTRNLHRALTEDAEEQGVSLNQLVVTVLSAYALPSQSRNAESEKQDTAVVAAFAISESFDSDAEQGAVAGGATVDLKVIQGGRK